MLEVSIIALFALMGVTRGISLSDFLSGLLNATAANGAPPMAMWLRTHTSTPYQIRQNIAAMFVVVNLCSLIAIHLKLYEKLVVVAIIVTGLVSVGLGVASKI